MSGNDVADAVVVAAQVVGAVAAAVAAWAAWKAASASRDTSRDAEAALALAIAPKLTNAMSARTFDAGDRLTRTIDLSFDPTHPASDLTLWIKYRDGRTESHERPTLGGESWRVELERTWQGEPPFGETLDEARLLYSDKRGIARYELRGGGSYFGTGDDRRENPRDVPIFTGAPRIIAPPHLRNT